MVGKSDEVALIVRTHDASLTRELQASGELEHESVYNGRRSDSYHELHGIFNPFPL